MTVSCPLATSPPFGTAGVEGSRVSHDLDGISPVPVVFSMCCHPDSAAVCACIRQETIVHEVGSLPDFFNGNGVFPVVDDSLSGFAGIVIKRLVESGMEVDGPEWVGRIRKGGCPGREWSAPLGSLGFPHPMLWCPPPSPFRFLRRTMVCVCLRFRRLASHAGRGGRHDERFKSTGQLYRRDD